MAQAETLGVDKDEEDDDRPTDELIHNEELWFPSWPPPNPRAILAEREAYRHRLRYRRYRAPEGIIEDSPLYGLSRLYGLFRLYEQIMADYVINMRNELEVFWWTRWPVCNIPDPGEQVDPERYTASTPKKYEEVPAWTEKVAPLKELLHIPHSQPCTGQLTSLEDKDADPHFRKKNILAIRPNIHFV
ncbi:hypothetical protein C8A05DRAFT_43597 [Staphylotrichum tortipilum]|uniref:Uncharacterized protein n=1 Tax=Staphylotrichum tortipilum TaxID=2831512 RepID=A0AAN6MLG3_9PEZI|nr:hypothetical protein C8A05DRAFT_43597 [Staphylotrichum longicolle]